MGVLEIGWKRCGGMVGAISDIGDDSALGGEFGAHPVVQGAQIIPGKKAARYAGLIGEEEYKISGLVEAAERLRCIRHPANPVLRAHIAVVVIDDAVASEKCGGPSRGGGGGATPPVRPAPPLHGRPLS